MNKARRNMLTDAFVVLERLIDNLEGLTAQQIKKDTDLPITIVYRTLEFLVDEAKWVVKFQPEFGPKRGYLYKTKYLIRR